MKNNRFASSSPTPDEMLSTAADHDVGLPSLVLYCDDVTAIQMLRFAFGLEISAKDTACPVTAPYKSGSFSP